MRQIEKRIALITGANKGIGLEIARQLGRADVVVLIGARDAGRGERATATLRNEGIAAEAIQLDVTDTGSVRTAATDIDARHGRLDILVNNAGIGDPGDGPPLDASIEAVRRILETNFIGALAVTQAMVPLLRKAAKARIVNMSSSLGSLALNGDPSSEFYQARLIGYNAAKAALNMLTVQLAEQLKGTGIVVNAACPGYTRTDLNGNTGYLSVPEAASTPVRLALLRGDQPSGRFLNVGGELPW